MVREQQQQQMDKSASGMHMLRRESKRLKMSKRRRLLGNQPRINQPHADYVIGVKTVALLAWNRSLSGAKMAFRVYHRDVRYLFSV